MKTGKVEPDADAEAILWEVYVTDEESGDGAETVLNHYLRIKILNDRGRESFSKMEIPFGKIDGVGFDVKIKDIAARTTKPDGTAVELKATDIFDRDVIKGNGVKLRAKSFAVPGIEAGAVIEYRWKEIRGAVSYYQRLQFAREIPVELVQYHVKALPHPTLGMTGQAFNVQNPKFTQDKQGFWLATVTNVPSFKEEEMMPPEYNVRPWLLLYYTKENKTEAEKFWKEYSKDEFNLHKGMIKVSDEVKQAAAEAVGNESDPDKKVKQIFDYVRLKIKNIFDDRFNLSADDLKKLKGNKNTAETIKKGQGGGHDINMLFAAMVMAAGLDARVVNLPSRSDIFFPKWFTDDYFMRAENVAVKIGDTWKFFDPASRYSPYGMLKWEEEGQPALISDSKDPVWAVTQLSPAKNSMEKRSGKFKLLEDGTLEGMVTIEFTGHLAVYYKELNDHETAQQQENALKNLVKYNILSSSVISDISIENVSDPDKPFKYVFKLRVPDYATRTGKRLFFQPNVFERSSKPVFESNSRHFDIYFHYPYSENDEITLEIPAGWELESPDAPPVIKDANGIGIDKIEIAVTNDGKFIIYARNFSFGNGGKLRFDKSSYPVLKALFEGFYKSDTHALTLKQSVKAASGKP